MTPSRIPTRCTRRPAGSTPPNASTSRCSSPSTTPSTRRRGCRASASYQRDVQKFVKLFPHVHQYQSWDEANRGNVAHAFSSPSAGSAAKYYQALLRVCKGCTVIGLDVLDQASIGGTLQLHRGIQARDRASAHDHADDLGPAQLLRRQPPGKLAHAEPRERARRPGVAHRDRRDRAVRPGVPEQARLRADAGGEGRSSTCSRSPAPCRGSSACTSTTGPAAATRRASTPG